MKMNDKGGTTPDFFATLLGDPRITGSGKKVSLPGRQDVLNLLLYLLVNSERVVPRDVAISELWPGTVTTEARGRLRRALHRLRKYLRGMPCAVDNCLHASRQSIAWIGDGIPDTDIGEIVRLVRQVESAGDLNRELVHRLSERRDELQKVALEGIDGRWVNELRLCVSALRQRVLLLLLEAYEAIGEHDQVAGVALELARSEVLAERYYQQAIDAHLLLDDPMAALRVLCELEVRLRDELQVEMAEPLKQLQETLRSGSAELVDSGLSRRDSGLVEWRGSNDLFVGAEDRIDLVREAFLCGRLVVLTGPGGIGKTRLAEEYVGAKATDYPGGVRFVSLAGMRCDSSVLDAVLVSLGLEIDQTDPVKRIVALFEQEKPALLVVDNVEHVLHDARDVILDLLLAHDDLRVLVTSRCPLQVSPEVEIAVPPLDYSMVPNTSSEVVVYCDAVRLLMARIALIGGGARCSASDDEIDDMVFLCRYMEGNPLGIEILAGHMAVLRPGEVRRHLLPSLIEFRNPRRQAAIRHSSLWEATDWSYRLLSSQEKSVFCQLALFPGSVPLRMLKALEQRDRESRLALDSVVVLRRLARNNLVRLQDVNGEECLWMAPFLRDYAMGWLRELGQLDRAQAIYVELVELEADEAFRLFQSGAQEESVARLRAVNPILEEALALCLRNQDYTTALRISVSCWRYWYVSGQCRDACHRIGVYLEKWNGADSSGKLEIRARNAQGALYMGLGQYRAALEAFAQAVELSRAAGVRSEMVPLLQRYSQALEGVGDLDAAIEVMRECSAIQESHEDSTGVVESLAVLAHLQLMSGDVRAAIGSCLQGLELTDVGEAGDFSRIAVLSNLGHCYYWVGDYGRAERSWGEALADAERIGSDAHASALYDSLGLVAHRCGDYLLARDRLNRAVQMSRDLSDSASLATSYCNLAGVFMDEADYQSARRYIDECERIARVIGDSSMLRYIECLWVEYWVAACALGSDEKLPGWIELSRERFPALLHAMTVRATGLIKYEAGDLSQSGQFLLNAVYQFIVLVEPYEVARTLDYLVPILVARNCSYASGQVLRTANEIRATIGTSRSRHLLSYLASAAGASPESLEVALGSDRQCLPECNLGVQVADVLLDIRTRLQSTNWLLMDCS